MRDILQEIWSTARRNKLRTTLTGFAVAWGIFMLIFLLGCGNGLINAQMTNMNRFLDNSMMVGGGRTSQAYDGLSEGRLITLDNRDITATDREFEQHIDDVGAQVEREGVTISNGSNYFSGSLEGVYPNEQEISKIKMICGRFINPTDLEMQRKSLVLDDSQARELCPKDYHSLLGQYVKVGSLAFRVVGIYKGDKSRFSSSVYVPFSTLRTMYNIGDKTDNIVFTFHGLPTEEANEQFETDYRSRLNKNHRASPDDESAVWVWNRFTQNMQMNKGISFIHIALWVIGIFTLLSGIVGVSNIMLITTFFGYIGMVLGIGANLYMDSTVGNMKVDSGLFEATMFVDPTVGLDVCIEATIVMIIAGTLAGLTPAYKAAHILPIEALRAE